MVLKHVNGKEDGIGLYMKDVRKTNTLTIQEEVELSKKIKEGDEEALSKLILSNLRFVIKIAKEYQNHGIPMADLISEGNYGLIVAAKKFDHTKGFRFISYAVWWIKQSILQSLNEDSRTVRLPVNIITKIAKVKKEIEKFERDNHRDPVGNEVDVINIPSCTSLNNIINEEGDELINMIENKMFSRPDVIDEEEELIKKNELIRAMNGLNRREKEIINSYFGITGESMTLEMIGEELNLTKERIRQIKESAIRKIRNKVGNIFNI